MSDWFDEAQKLYKPGEYGYKRIAKQFGISPKTVESRFLREKKRNGFNAVGVRKGIEEQKPKTQDMGSYYIVSSGKHTFEITKAKLREIKILYCETKLEINTLCRKVDIPRRDFFILKNAFSITHDDVPALDEEITNDNIDSLVAESIERKKANYFLKLQEEEIKELRKEVNLYREKDYTINKIQKLSNDFFTEFAKEYKTPNVILLPKVDTGLMLELPVVDLHFGKMSWHPETGENYDYKIAEKRFMEVIYQVVEETRSNKFEKIVFPIGNDFFNFDTINGTTTKGTIQTNDLRWQKMYTKGNEVLIRAIDILSQYAPVDVLEVPGNHDEVTMYHSIINIASWFRNDKNVFVDISPKKRKYREFGSNLIGYTHMDKERKRIEGNMQVEVPEAWGRTKYREWHGGHLHSEQVRELNGIKIRNLTSVTATDSWHCESGYVGAIAVNQSFIWDKEKGLKNIIYTTVE